MGFKENLDDIVRNYREKRANKEGQENKVESYPIATDYPLYSQNPLTYFQLYNKIVDYYKKRRFQPGFSYS